MTNVFFVDEDGPAITDGFLVKVSPYYIQLALDHVKAMLEQGLEARVSFDVDMEIRDVDNQIDYEHEHGLNFDRVFSITREELTPEQTFQGELSVFPMNGEWFFDISYEEELTGMHYSTLIPVEQFLEETAL